MGKAGLLLAGLLLLGAGVQNWFAYDSVYWDDLRFPASIVRLGAGSGTSADRDTDGTILFSGTQDEEAHITAQMPHGYVTGTNIEVHFHWAKTTSAAGDVCFRVDYDCKDIAETFTNALGTTISAAYEVDDSDTAWKHAYMDASFDPAFTGVSGICIMRLWRDVSGDGASCLDTYEVDVKLYEFDIHYQMDQPGSVGEVTKYQ